MVEKTVKSKLRKNDHVSTKVINDDEEAAMNDVRWLWNSNSEVVWVDHESSKYAYNEVHCEKDYDGKVVDHESSMCMTGTLQDDKDVHEDKILKNDVRWLLPNDNELPNNNDVSNACTA